MAIVRINNSTELTAALRSVAAGTTFELASGNYTLSARSGDYKGAIITEAAGASVTFTDVSLRGVSNMTLDGVSFRGTGAKAVTVADAEDLTIRNASFTGPTTQGSVGLRVDRSEGFTLENSDFVGFSTGMALRTITDLTIRGNDLSNIAWDGLIAGRIHDALFADNHISLNTPAGRKHTDGMQFHNAGINDPMTDVVIRDNHIETHNGSSHGIYMANAMAMNGGGTSTFFRNLTIEDNVIVSGQVSGLAVGQTIGLDISGNVILQDTAFRSTREAGIPVIRVHADSTDVSITGNVTHKVPEASGVNWFPTGKPEPEWTVSGNSIVPLGTLPGGPPSPPPPPPPPPPPSPPPPPPPAAEAIHHRFDNSGPTDVVSGLDFGRGDTIEFYNYKGGTFHGQKGGNFLLVTVKGALIDSVADLRELDAASAAVSIHAGAGDRLVIDIAQPAGVHSVEILDFAHLYLA